MRSRCPTIAVCSSAAASRCTSSCPAVCSRRSAARRPLQASCNFHKEPADRVSCARCSGHSALYPAPRQEYVYTKSGYCHVSSSGPLQRLVSEKAGCRAPDVHLIAPYNETSISLPLHVGENFWRQHTAKESASASKDSESRFSQLQSPAGQRENVLYMIRCRSNA